MATKLNIGKETRKNFKKAKEKYDEAIVATYVDDESIAMYYEDKMEEAKELISEAKGSTKDMLKLLEKDSNKRKDYEKIENELNNMSLKIKKITD